MKTVQGLSYAGAAVLRMLLFVSPFKEDFTNRVEISTPVNSLKRVIESLYRVQVNADTYSSDVVHESPVHLLIYKIILAFPEKVALIFIFSDLLTAHFIYLVAKKYMFDHFVNQTKNKHSYCKDIQGLVIYGIDYAFIPLFAMNVYLFNPYSLLNCIAQTTTVFTNLFLGILFYAITHQRLFTGIFAMTYLTLQSFYPILFISPFFLSMKHKMDTKNAICSVIICTIFVGAAFIWARVLHGSWSFMTHTYGFIWNVRDQQPNVGVFWYFFMEMFEHFRTLFICSYQMNVTILYFVPLSIKFRKDPLVLSVCFALLIATFKSYPSIGDFAFTIALLPIFSFLYHCMQQIFISGVAILVTSALGPILWDLWIYWGSANANFYFGTTLAFITAHIFILTDICLSMAKYEHLLKFGIRRQLNGKPAKLVLE